MRVSTLALPRQHVARKRACAGFLAGRHDAMWRAIGCAAYG